MDLVKIYLDYESRRKSFLVTLVLTFLFGPLGLFYVSWVVALVMIFVAGLAVVSAIEAIASLDYQAMLMWSIVGPLVYWASIVVGLLICESHNKDLLKELLLYSQDKVETQPEHNEVKEDIDRYTENDGFPTAIMIMVLLAWLAAGLIIIAIVAWRNTF